MTVDSVKGEDGGATAAVNANLPRGKFKALKDISVSDGPKDLSAKKGETLELQGAVIQALINVGAIEPE